VIADGAENRTENFREFQFLHQGLAGRLDIAWRNRAGPQLALQPRSYLSPFQCPLAPSCLRERWLAGFGRCWFC